MADGAGTIWYEDGDVDGDGLDDLLIGAPGAGATSGTTGYAWLITAAALGR